MPTHLALIDALEGGDGAGNWIRLDTLIAGRNPVAADAVGLAMAGYRAADYKTFQLCAERGLGPCDLDEIEVVGKSIEEVSFPLERIRENVLEMPVRFCLDLLSTDELRQIHRAFAIYGFLSENAVAPSARKELLVLLADILETEGFFDRILAQCSAPALSLLELLIARGGTSGDIEAIRDAFAKQSGGPEYQNYSPTARTLTRLGLAYAVEGTCRNYFLLPRGVVAAFDRIRAE